jgi:hypothetical protein
MPFRRIAALPPLIASDVLTSQLVGIGMNFAAPPAHDPNIEDSIVFASIEGMEKQDLRVLAMLVTWFGIHAPWVNADRLTTLAGAQSSARVRAFWSALARWQRKDRRFVRLSAAYKGPRQNVLEVGTEFQLLRHGEDPRFMGSAIRVAANILRDRPADVLSPSLLARRHRVYRFRIMMGPSYRADMWAALESDPTLSTSTLARVTYGSFATAWHVRRDFLLLREASSRRTPPERKKKPAASISGATRGLRRITLTENKTR